jgi:hypothetical protein
MWVLTGEREYFCGIHISVKSIRIVDEAASREEERLDPSTVHDQRHLLGFTFHGINMR